MEFADAYVNMIRSEQTGALNVKNGKRQWMFFFSKGKLVETRSNIQGEQGAALQERFQDSSKADLLKKQVELRIERCFAPLTKVEQNDEATSQSQPINTMDVFAAGMSRGMTENDLRKACGDSLSQKLTPKENLGFTDGEIDEFVSRLKGMLTLETTISRSPISNEKALSVIWLCEQLDFLLQPEKDDDDVIDFDLDAIISQEKQKARGISEADEEELTGINEPIDDTPAKHPMADRLDELEIQLDQAENHFDRLGLSWEASEEDFRQAFRNLSMELHPDRYADATLEMQDMAADLFNQIREAWDIISDAEARKKYTDKEIHGVLSEEEQAMEQLQVYWAAEEKFKRGLALFNQGRLPQAHDLFGQAVAACPDELEFRAYFGYTTFSTVRSSDPQGAREAIEIIREVIDLNQSQERRLDSAWVLLGRAYREIGETDFAKRILTNALKMNPNNGDALRELRRLTGKKAAGKSSSEGDKNQDGDKKGGKGLLGGLFGRKK